MTAPTPDCCMPMTLQLAWTCDDHADLWDCPDAIVMTDSAGKVGLPVRDGGRSLVMLHFCPWCGSRLSSVEPSRPRPLLAEALPDLAAELEQELRDMDEAAIADRVPSLRIHSRCRCDDPTCGSFYTGPQLIGDGGAEHRTVVVDLPETWMTVLDVVDGAIRYIELIDSPEIARAVRDLDLG